jgi:hypothetical protein
MNETMEQPQVDSGSDAGTLTVEVQNVTRTRSVQATFQTGLRADAAAAALASKLALPANIPYSLRSNKSAGYLDESKSIGSQVAPGERLTLTPRSHLGSGISG